MSVSLQPRNGYFNEHFVDFVPMQIIYCYYKYFLQIIKYVLSLFRLDPKSKLILNLFLILIIVLYNKLNYSLWALPVFTSHASTSFGVWEFILFIRDVSPTSQRLFAFTQCHFY